MFAEYYRLFPHFGQNFAEGGNTVPQRLQTSAIVCSGAVLFICCNWVPQLTQRLALVSLSAPQLGQGL